MKNPLSPRKHRRKVGALFWIALMLFGSAILRLGVEAGPAIAREATNLTDAETATETSEATEPQPPREIVPDDLENLLRELQKREAALKERERRYEDRMKALEIADDAIEKKLAELVQAEEKLRKTLAQADGANETDLAKLTSVYEQMKPKDAAAVFETMDPAFSAGFLARMRPESAAGILAKLPPDTAYSISAIMAGRHMKVPKN